MGNRPLINLVSRGGGPAVFIQEWTRKRKEWIESRKIYILLDGCYLFFEDYLQEKKLCLYPETVPKLGQSLEESLAGGGLVKNFKIFWKNDKTIIGVRAIFCQGGR